MNSRKSFVVVLGLALAGIAAADQAIDVGSRLELFADAYLIDRLSGGAAQRLNHPAPQEVSIVMDKPWEGNALNYVTVFQDDAPYRMYYRGADVAYYDPYVPVIRPTREHAHWAGTKSVTWDRDTIAGFDAVVIATAHKAVTYDELAEWAQCIVDTRNTMSNVARAGGKVWKA